MTVFDVFSQIDYTFLEISRGNVYGNRVINRRVLRGVFKLREKMSTSNNMETVDSDARLHAHTNDFTVNPHELVGQGVEVNGQQYSIEGVSVGANFDNGVIEHLRFELQKANFVEDSNGE